MFDPAMQQITRLAREVWAFLAGLIVVVALLGGLYNVLQGAGGAAFGGSRMVSIAVMGVLGLFLLAILGFVVLPALGGMLQSLIPPPPF